MSDLYPIVEVQPGWIEQPEEMGSKKKFWYLSPNDKTNWLFKYPQPNTGQHWAEKIAAEVAGLLGIPHAKVELAVFNDKQGSVTESFARGGRELIHGNQILEMAIDDYNPKEKFHQSNHTLANIWQVMEHIFVEPEAVKRAKFGIAEYMVLDALIGNTDRHHENWGILRKRTGDHWKGFLAPSFDHASSLGRELQDVKRDKYLTENRMGNYAEKGRGGIYWSKDEQHGPSPVELVRRAASDFPKLFHSALMKLEKLDKDSITNYVNCVPDDWMTPSARTFAVELMHYNLKQLGELIR